ncbi:MAG TPA: SAM-dependent chlorinase/fluorinase [Syntrophorhabdaceae bacterium]|mgnify:CR=1 FL=1|nr:SAM-dependent chlorinase/fluorinase [Syntrophorhabdaceae bacterium]
MEELPIITLLTDFGLKDTYVGQMKAVIFSINPRAKIIDITHEIEPQDIREAAFLIKEYYGFFPQGSIHVAVVDPEVGSSRRPLAIKKEGQIFIGPDNGIFSLILDDACKIYTIENKEFMLKKISTTFHGRDIFAPVAANISLGIDFNLLGKRIWDPVLLSNIYPKVESNNLYGEIVRFDRFGNAITNIDSNTFYDFIAHREYRIEIGAISFSSIANSYFEGDLICLFGSSGYLEFGCYKGSFRDRMGASRGDEVRVKITF